MHTISFSNGQVMQARTWKALAAKLWAEQIKWGHDLATEEEFRLAMAKRAYRWSGATIDLGARWAEFFRELERAKLLVIERGK